MGNCLGRCLSGKSGLMHSTDEQEMDLVPEDTSGESYIFRIIKFKRKKRPQFLDQFWERKDSSYSRLSQNTTQPIESSDIQLQCLDAQTLLVTARELPSGTKGFNNNYTELGGAASSSRASSSLDLEWEHEYNQNSQMNTSWLFLPEENSESGNAEEEDEANDIDRQPNLTGIRTGFVRSSHLHPSNSQRNILRTSSKTTSWSHISTPESLEWDIDEEQQKQLKLEDDNLDDETLELLHEIEILKNKVLSETGGALEADLSDSTES